MINNNKDRFEIKEGDRTMKAVVTVGMVAMTCLSIRTYLFHQLMKGKY